MFPSRWAWKRSTIKRTETHKLKKQVAFLEMHRHILKIDKDRKIDKDLKKILPGSFYILLKERRRRRKCKYLLITRKAVATRFGETVRPAGKDFGTCVPPVRTFRETRITWTGRHENLRALILRNNSYSHLSPNERNEASKNLEEQSRVCRCHHPPPVFDFPYR